MCHINMGNFKNGVRDCKDALSVAEWNNEKDDDPLPLKALMRKGQAYAGLGKYEKATRDLEKAFELAPQNKGIIKVKGEVEAAWAEAKREEAVKKKVEESLMSSDLMGLDDDDDDEEEEKEEDAAREEDDSSEGEEKESGGGFKESSKKEAGKKAAVVQEAPNDLHAVGLAVKALDGDDESTEEALTRLDSLLVHDDDNRIHFRSVEGIKKVLFLLKCHPLRANPNINPNPKVLPLLKSHPLRAVSVLTKASLNEKNVALIRDGGPASHPHQPIKDILVLMSHGEIDVRYNASLCMAVIVESGDRTRNVVTEAGAGKALFARLSTTTGAIESPTANVLRCVKLLSGEVE